MKKILRLVVIASITSILLAGFSLTAVIVPSQAHADDLYFQKDTLIPDVIVIKNKYGDKVGTLKKDSLIPKKWVLQWKDKEKKFSVDLVDMDTYLNGGKK